jgi:hypothetical protein
LFYARSSFLGKVEQRWRIVEAPLMTIDAVSDTRNEIEQNKEIGWIEKLISWSDSSFLSFVTVESWLLDSIDPSVVIHHRQVSRAAHLYRQSI